MTIQNDQISYVKHVLAPLSVFFKALDYAARHGAAPQLIGGDFNFPLDDLLQEPLTLQGQLLMRRLVDADSELAAAAGRPPPVFIRRGAGRTPHPH